MADILVHAGGNLQSAMNSAAAGDRILLDADATYTGFFTAPVHSGSTDITIQTDTTLPGSTTRVTPTSGAAFARLRAPSAGPCCFNFAPGAHHWKLLGLAFPQVPTGQGECLSIGQGEVTQNTLASVPHHITVDRVWIYGDYANGGQKRGIGLNGATVTITNCYIEKCVRSGQDAQAISGSNGPGPFTITNNFLQASGENLLFGGDSARIANLVSTGLTITGNHLQKPLSWRTDGSNWSVKNLFELKNAQTVTFEGNLLEGCWVKSQAGSAIQLTPRNQNGTTPWVIVKDVIIRNNIIRHAANGIDILGTDNIHPSQRTRNITISNNLFYDINRTAYGGGFGEFLEVEAPGGVGPDGLIVTHNTAICTGQYTMYFNGTTPGFVLRDNILTRGTYGVRGDSTGEGSATFTAHTPGADIRNNVFIGAASSLYPANNFYPATIGAVQFVDVGSDDYRLIA